jgi:hypothetical protein
MAKLRGKNAGRARSPSASTATAPFEPIDRGLDIERRRRASTATMAAATVFLPVWHAASAVQAFFSTGTMSVLDAA